MKTRIGFVSNSSSTSFIILTTQRRHDEAVAKLNEAMQKTLEQIKPLKRVRFLGTDLVQVTACEGNSNWISSGNWTDSGDIWDVVEAYKEALGNGGDVFIGGVDN